MHAVVQVYVNKSRLYFPRGFLCKNSIYLFIFGNVVDLIDMERSTISLRQSVHATGFTVGPFMWDF